MQYIFESIKNCLNTIFILVLELEIGTENKLHSVKPLIFKHFFEYFIVSSNLFFMPSNKSSFGLSP